MRECLPGRTPTRLRWIEVCRWVDYHAVRTPLGETGWLQCRHRLRLMCTYNASCHSDKFKYRKCAIYITRKLCYRKKWPRDARYISGSNEPLRRYGHSKLSKMAACRQLGFHVTRNSAIRSADPENHTLEPNMKWIGSPVAEILPFAYLGAYGQWRNYERRSEAIASGRQAVGGALGRRVVCFTAEFLKTEGC